MDKSQDPQPSTGSTCFQNCFLYCIVSVSEIALIETIIFRVCDGNKGSDS
jgi:hypothetical protein